MTVMLQIVVSLTIVTSLWYTPLALASIWNTYALQTFLVNFKADFSWLIGARWCKGIQEHSKPKIFFFYFWQNKQMTKGAIIVQSKRKFSKVRG
jgi:hypothetical protein